MPARSVFTSVRRALTVTTAVAASLSGIGVIQAASSHADPEATLCTPTPNYTPSDTTKSVGVATPDGRFVVSYRVGSPAFGLVRLDRTSGTELPVAVTTDDQAPNGAIDSPAVTADGRFVVFRSVASNLVSGDTNGQADVFIRDMQLGVTERVSVADDEAQANAEGAAPTAGHNNAPSVSADGRYVAFTSTSAVLTPTNAGQQYPTLQVFVRDRTLGTTTRESQTQGGVVAGGANYQPSLSADGSLIAFSSAGNTFDPQSNGLVSDVIVRTRATGATSVVSGLGYYAWGIDPTLSADGSSVAFLGSGTTAGVGGIALHPVVVRLGSGQLLNAEIADAPMEFENPQSPIGPGISADGRFVSYRGVTSNRRFIVVRDLTTGATHFAFSGSTYDVGGSPMAISDDGRLVSFVGTQYEYARRVWLSPAYLQSFSVAGDQNVRNQIRQGAQHVILPVTGFNLTDDATFDFTQGITINSFDAAADGRTGTLDISVSPTAPTDPNGFEPTIISPEGCRMISSNSQLRILKGVEISQMDPMWNKPGATRTVTVVGAGFRAGATVTVGGGLTASNPQVVDATHATVQLAVPANATAGWKTLTWTNSDGTGATCTCVGIDTVAPKLTAVGPSDIQMTKIFVDMSDDRGVDWAGTPITITRNGVSVAYTRTVVPPANNLPGYLELKIANMQPAVYAIRITPTDVAGNAAAPVTRYVSNKQTIATLNAYGAFQGGAETASGDVDGDGYADVITAAGPGGGPHVRAFRVNVINGQTVEAASFYAYSPNFSGGVRVASADVDGDGISEIVTAPGPGGAPLVRVWKVKPGNKVTLYAQFMAYTSNITTGLSITGGDVDGDGNDEVITAPSAGAGPHVRAFSVADGKGYEKLSFMAYNAAFTGGVRVSALDIDGDGYDEIATGAGPGGGPHVQIFFVPDDLSTPVPIASFFAYDERFAGGVTVGSGDLNGDGYDELLLSAGGGGGPHVKVIAFDEESYGEVGGFYAYDANFGGGVSAAAGDLDGDGDDDVITTPGPGMPVTIVARRFV